MDSCRFLSSSLFMLRNLDVNIIDIKWINQYWMNVTLLINLKIKWWDPIHNIQSLPWIGGDFIHKINDLIIGIEQKSNTRYFTHDEVMDCRGSISGFSSCSVFQEVILGHHEAFENSAEVYGNRHQQIYKVKYLKPWFPFHYVEFVISNRIYVRFELRIGLLIRKFHIVQFYKPIPKVQNQRGIK